MGLLGRANMLRFKTEADRMKHRQAKLIPSSMWRDEQLFYETLNDTVLSLMKVKPMDLISHLSKSVSKLNDQWLKKQAWLGIALSFPDDLALLQQVATALNLNKNNVFSLLTVLGNLTLLQEFTLGHNDDIQEMIADNEFYPYRKAAENGHINVLKFLVSKAPDVALKMISAINFSAYKKAAQNGHIEVLNYLEVKVPDLVLNMIKAQDFCAYRAGAVNGYWELLKHLEAKAPGLVKEMVEAANFDAYRKTIENGYLEVSKWMLSRHSNLLAYAEMHMHEYGALSITPFITQQLTALHRDALNVSTHSVFDIADPEQAKICFYMIRNLIRRNDRTFDDEIRFLLTIPSVKALAHRAVTVGQSNELVRLALTIGNQEAASILLNSSEIRILAEQNNFYRAEVGGQLDLAQLARDRESSMTALAKGERQRLDGTILHYAPILKEIGVDKLMDDLRVQLRLRYEAKPAFILNDCDEKMILPMDFVELQKLRLSEKKYQQALTAYYQHKDHTAWRYIAKPNSWMDPDAPYVYFNEMTFERWSTFAEYQPLIVMFWLAAADKSIPATDGHTLETRLDHFIDELALIGRAHNWDKIRVNAKEKEEEYDDLTGDRPSCFSGVKRRLFQSVIGHPLINVLTEDMILEEIRNFACGHFQTQINKENQRAFKEAFDDYIINTQDLCNGSKRLLVSLNIDDEKKHEFERYLSNKYGTQYTDDFTFHNLVRNKLSFALEKADFFSNCHALILDGITGLYQMLNNGLEEKNEGLVNASQVGFFKSKQSDEIPVFVDASDRNAPSV